MRANLTLATTRRVLTQLRRDPRTLAMLLLLPIMLVWLIDVIFGESRNPNGRSVFDTVGPRIIGIFPLIIMFIVTSVTTLRERQSGTLERLMVSPIRKADVILGYALAFGLIGILQALLLTGVAVWPLGLQIPGGSWRLGVIMILDGLLGCALGLLASSVARTEFQAVQMMPAFIFPQLLLSGLLAPRDSMPRALELLSNVLPVSYSIDAVNELVAGRGTEIWGEVVVLALAIIASLLLSALTLRRRTV